MSKSGRIASRHSRVIATLVGLLVAATATAASAQQARPKSDKPAALPGAMPVTPFGPRVKPPRAPAGAPARTAPRLPKPDVIATYGIWKVMCEKAPAPAGKAQAAKKTCYVAATGIDPKRKGVYLALFILRLKGKGPDGKTHTVHMINMRAPTGVYLPTGIGLEIDGKAVARAPFLRCSPIFCESTAEARTETLNKLKKGKKAKFIYYAAPGAGLPLVFDLKGFSAALKKLAELQK